MKINHVSKQHFYTADNTVGSDFFSSSALDPFLMKSLCADFARPWSLWRLFEWGNKTIHVIATITIVAEQKLVVILRRPAQSAALALDALPRILLHGNQHVWRELEAGWVTWKKGTRNIDEYQATTPPECARAVGSNFSWDLREGKK